MLFKHTHTHTYAHPVNIHKLHKTTVYLNAQNVP